MTLRFGGPFPSGCDAVGSGAIERPRMQAIAMPLAVMRFIVQSLVRFRLSWRTMATETGRPTRRRGRAGGSVGGARLAPHAAARRAPPTLTLRNTPSPAI